MWQWEQGSVLYSDSPYIRPRDIFQAVCDELGRYYQGKELKYAKSKRELKWKGVHLWCTFGLWSSHSNIRGEWVCLEIVTSLFATDLSGMERKGVLSFDFRSQHFNVYGIDSKLFEEIISYIDETMRKVKELDTKTGIENFLLTTQKSTFIKRNPNNQQYLKTFGLD